MNPSIGRALYLAEPPAMWRLRRPVVVDCSVLVALLFAEPNAADAATMLCERRLLAPTLLPFEISNVARSKLRSGAQTEAVQDALGEYTDLSIELHTVPPQRLLALATDYNLSAYDAAYLWLAGELQAPLATFDRRLAEAAQRHLGR